MGDIGFRTRPGQKKDMDGTGSKPGKGNKGDIGKTQSRPRLCKIEARANTLFRPKLT